MERRQSAANLLSFLYLSIPFSLSLLPMDAPTSLVAELRLLDQSLKRCCTAASDLTQEVASFLRTSKNIVHVTHRWEFLVDAFQGSDGDGCGPSAAAAAAAVRGTGSMAVGNVSVASLDESSVQQTASPHGGNSSLSTTPSLPSPPRTTPFAKPRIPYTVSVFASGGLANKPLNFSAEESSVLSSTPTLQSPPKTTPFSRQKSAARSQPVQPLSGPRLLHQTPVARRNFSWMDDSVSSAGSSTPTMRSPPKTVKLEGRTALGARIVDAAETGPTNASTLSLQMDVSEERSLFHTPQSSASNSSTSSALDVSACAKPLLGSMSAASSSLLARQAVLSAALAGSSASSVPPAPVLSHEAVASAVAGDVLPSASLGGRLSETEVSCFPTGVAELTGLAPEEKRRKLDAGGKEFSVSLLPKTFQTGTNARQIEDMFSKFAAAPELAFSLEQMASELEGVSADRIQIMVDVLVSRKFVKPVYVTGQIFYKLVEGSK